MWRIKLSGIQCETSVLCYIAGKKTVLDNDPNSQKYLINASIMH